MSFLYKMFDPSKKVLRSYEKNLIQVKKYQSEYKNSIQTIEDVQARTQVFKDLFEPIRSKRDESISLLLQDTDLSLDDLNEKRADVLSRYHAERKNKIMEIRDQAFALHHRACEIVFNTEIIQADEVQVIWDMIPYDVQIMGAMGLNDGNISEMRTGEGKTLVATIAAYLNALSGEPVHVVTVNEYLAERDAMEMSAIYGVLGLTTGVILNSQNADQKKENYAKDVIYSTNNELGFDYLRDNMAPEKSAQTQSDLVFAIVDEVDSILIDEARTPLIISAPDNEPTSKYLTFREFAKKLSADRDYKVDEKMKSATLTEKGIEEVESLLGVDNIFVSEHYNDLHHIENALRAVACYKSDHDYIIRNEQIMLIDEHTGRIMDGRRLSNGLHQALEAKEGLEIQRESKTLANITFQNFFRLYEKLSGMTGTAKTEEEEFQKIYGLDVLVVPTNKPVIRDDKADLLFKNEKGKFDFLVKEIAKIHKTGQPILVGTVSVKKSEYLSALLQKSGIQHEVLNAKQDSREAEIITQAGQIGAITIATNMAGRGTDIKLGEGVVDLGGLYVIGTEKHETRRIDNQLRGRSGRQGDQGTTQFMVSPQDDIMRIFGGEKLFGVFNSPVFASLPDDQPLLQSGMLTRRITGVQKQVEGRNFDARKHVLEYDDVLDQHRRVVYRRRQKILDTFDQEEIENAEIDKQISRMLRGESTKLVNLYTDEDKEVQTDDLLKMAAEYLQNDTKITHISTNPVEATEQLSTIFQEHVDDLKTAFADRNFDRFQRSIYLSAIDSLWMAHIDRMSGLRDEVSFVGYAQKDPLMVYKEMAYDVFVTLLDSIEHKVVRGLLAANPQTQVQRKEIDLDALKKFVQTEKDKGADMNDIMGKLEQMGVKVKQAPTPTQSPGAAVLQNKPSAMPNRPGMAGFRQTGKNNKKKSSSRKKR